MAINHLYYRMILGKLKVRISKLPLKSADIIIFWFSGATLCPITLFELGAALERNQKIIVGIEPNYKRKIDVEVQTKLMNKNIPIVYSVEDLSIELIEII